MKRDKRKTLRNKADKLYQEVGLKLNPRCESCGKKATQIHHFIPKSLSSALRYDLKNAISLCNYCHFRHHSQSDPQMYVNFTNNKSAKWFEYIKSYRRRETKTTISFYEQAITNLTKELEKYEDTVKS